MMMTEDDKPTEKKPADIVEGFDLPQGEPVPPPELDATARGGVPLEPHVTEAEKRPSVTGKIVALVLIPLTAVVALIAFRALRQQPVVEYRYDCIVTAEEFLKGLSEDSEESVPAAYGRLHRTLRDRAASETVLAR